MTLGTIGFPARCPHIFHFSGHYFFLVLRIFVAILIHSIELMIRYIYGKSGKWAWLFSKMDKNRKSIKNGYDKQIRPRL